VRNLAKTLMVLIGAALGAPAFAATVVTLAPAMGHPNLPVTVTGSGFGLSEAVDIYLDTVDTALVASSATGTISVPITMPASAQPGSHFVTAIGRKSGNAASATFKVSTNWIESGFGAAHIAWNQYENTLSPSIVPSLELLWAAPIGSGHGAPAVVGGKAYVAAADGSGVYAFNAITGALIWHVTTAAAEPINSATAVVANAVYALGSTGILYAFNAANGTLLWSQQLASPGSASPLVVGGVIYVGSGSNVYAVATTNGHINWTAPTGGNIDSSVAVVGGRVFAGSEDHNVYAFNASTGVGIWSFTSGAGIHASPAVANGIVYIGSIDDNFYALRASTGLVVWLKTTGELILGSAAVANGLVYVVSIDDNLYAFNVTQGTTVWSVPLAESVAQVSVADGVVYTGDDDGLVTALDAKTGQYLVGVAAGTEVFGTPVVVNGMLYVSSNDGFLYAFAPGGPGADALHRSENAPPLSALHPDMRLVLMQ
jgi:outer membrane protein assembly factor BamB